MSPEITNRILQACNDPYNEVKIAAAYALGEGGNATPEVTRMLLAMSNDPYNEVKIAALKALGRIYRRK
ncbi:HEAT repeat domain-containing protein [Pantoea eucrina]|uniref:HEAT repeat domain-containing protein n=1 Tax=Pantoea eucrina TaxID=472693 RepID=UPI002FDA147C